MNCFYCGMSRTKKEGGYCVVYRCKERLEQDIVSRKVSEFNNTTLIYKVKTTKVVQRYEYGKLISTKNTIS